MKRTLLTIATLALLLVPATLAVAARPSAGVDKEPAVTNVAVAAAGVNFRASDVTPIGDSAFRLHGATRYETAAAISEFFWTPEDTYSVNLATGENWPDGLTLGASSGAFGPTLLVTRSTLPTATIEELRRLQPCYIYVAGGSDVISDAVVREAARYADPSACEEPR